MKQNFDENKLFDLFLDKENCRTEIRKPFVNNGWVAATETHFCLLIKPEYLKQTYEPGEKPNVSKILTESNLDITISRSELLEAIKAVSTEKEKRVIRPGVKCSECDGDGEVEWEYIDSDNYAHSEYFDCPICHGSGYKVNELTADTGRIVPSRSTTLGVYETPFSALLLLKVCDAMELLGIDKMQYVASYENKANRFILADGIQVIIMPQAYETPNVWVMKK